MTRLLQLSITFVLIVFNSIAQKSAIQLTINGDQGKHQISKHIYGHFSEHLGRCIYGGFYVGEENEVIPNMAGVRTDVIEALKDLQIPNLRWPGGCFADTYHWKDGVGPKSERPTIVNKWWGGVTEDNSFGTHDFLNLCEELGAEPYLAANVGSGTVQEFTQLVQYVTHDGVSPMADWRKENGREKPWKVKYWGVGNEMWGCGGHMDPEYYADIYNQYATFMTDWRNSDGFYRIASGANVDDYNWTEVLMRDIRRNLLEGLALHSYSFVEWNDKGSATDFSEYQYFSTMQTALRMEELVTRHSTIMDKYDPEKRVGLIVDEWGGWYNVEDGTNPGFLYQQNTMRDAMIAGVSLNIFNNHAERIRMANLAQTINVLQAVILTDEERMLLTPTYHVLKMYAVHQDAILLPVDFESPTYKYDGEELPAISVSASKDSEGKVNVSIVNIDSEKTHSVAVNLRGNSYKDVAASILRSGNLQDYNSFDDPDKIVVETYEGFKKYKSNLTVEMPPFSVVVIELK